MIRKAVRYLVGLLVVALLAGSAWFLVQRNQQSPEVFQTETVTTGDVVKKAVATGAIEPRREIVIKSRVSGVVEKLHVEPGELIERGTLIAKITVVPDAVTLNAAQARHETAKISTKNALSEMDRRKQLYSDELISKGEYDKYRFEYALKKEELDSALSNLQLIRDGGNGQGGTVSNEIRSTVSGTVLDVPVKEGESVTETNNFNEGTTIASIADMTDMIFVGAVDESEVGRIQEGLALRITIGAIEDKIFDGQLEFISPKGLKEDGAVQFQIRAAMAGRDDITIRAGFSANADIVLEQREEVAVLDERALIFTDDGIFVLRQTGEIEFEQQRIETGLSDGIQIEILDGLSVGDVVRVP